MFKRAVAAASCLAAVASAADHIQTKLREGVVASRAVNLGGWFVSEYWMCYNSPLYKGVPPEEGIKGEYGVMKFLGKEQGTKNFENHWSTWITEKDIQEIAEAGLNTVRVSTGFWIINDEDDSDKTEITNTYPRGGLKYLDTLVNDWAVKHNIAVMISLHAHRGSQNGNDHSAPVKLGDKLWAKDPVNVASSLKFATFIANRYKNSIAFLGLNLMNEPVWGQDYEVLWKYYKDAYKAIRADGNNCIIGTSPWLQEQGVGTMQDFMPCPEFYNVWHEFHVYYKWGWEGKPLSDVFAEASTYAATHFKPWTGNPIYLGEWSLGTADEDKRTDAELKEFASIQMKEAEQAQAGWAFWAWHHDDESKMTSGWSMRQLLRKGIITVPKGELKRTPNPKCPKVESTYSDSSSPSSGSGSAGKDSVSLFVPEKVKAGNTDANTTAMPSANATAKTNATNTTASKSAAAQPAGVLGAVVLTAVSSLLALTAF